MGEDNFEKAVIKNLIDSYGVKLKNVYDSRFPEPCIDSSPKIIDTIISENLIDFPDPSLIWPKNFKSDTQSLEYREKGNASLKDGSIKEALDFYSLALIFAEKRNSKPFALALANRSVALMRLEMHKDAIKDLKWCLETKTHPEEYKLHLRLGKCYSMIEETALALFSFENAKSTLPKSTNSTSAVFEEIARSLKSLRQKQIVDSFTNIQTSGSSKEANSQLNESISRPTKRFLNPSVQINFDPIRGRYAVAKSHIEVGEPILWDTASVLILHPQYARDHCFTCVRHTLTPIPCGNCVGTVFCSEECHQKSSESHSTYDCRLGILDSYLGSYSGAGHASQFYMAFKLVAVKLNADFFVEKLNKFVDNSEGVSLYNEEFDEYSLLYNLAKHTDDFWTAMSAVFLIMKLLETGQFFEISRSSTEKLQEVYPRDHRKNVRVFIADIVFRYYVGILSNNHSFSEISDVNMKVNLRTTGLGVFPAAASLFNHSCDPNTTPLYVGTYQITVATCPILPGQEICHIYQGHFGNTSRPRRRQVLREMFHFDCNCLACDEDYPLSENLCKSYAECGRSNLRKNLSQQELLAMDKRHSEFGERVNEALIEKNNVVEALAVYCDRLRLVSECIKKPHIFFLSSRAAISDCLFMLYSNRSKFVTERDKMTGIYSI